jgi:hypothetical protein
MRQVGSNENQRISTGVGLEAQDMLRLFLGDGDFRFYALFYTSVEKVQQYSVLTYTGHQYLAPPSETQIPVARVQPQIQKEANPVLSVRL